ncbi:HAD family hydrolase [Nocardiopsis sp. NPDC049922]|uniref:HAD family hydrolase n=1 Tax=Nocardiopsis sp. NPDC049922 TaxID=3155157 RepID=UPI00340EF137
MTHQPRQRRGIVFDLFGTLVAAPTIDDRQAAAREIATVTGALPCMVEQLLVESWPQRHDGTLPTLDTLADYLAVQSGAPGSASKLARLLASQAASRLEADDGVITALQKLRSHGLRIAVLSDASADIAHAWPRSSLFPLVDFATFSCVARSVKPDAGLYERCVQGLALAARRLLYCGDGGGDELWGATRAGMRAVRVHRRGGPGSLAYGERPWDGPCIPGVEELLGFPLLPEETT